MSERLRTSRMIGFRDRPIERYLAGITLVRILTSDPLVLGWAGRWQLITRTFRARHRIRAELAVRAWLDYRSGIAYWPDSLRVEVFGPVGHPD